MTLIEMLVAIAVTALVMTATADSALSLYRVNGTDTQEIFQVSKARSALASIEDNLRQAGYSDNGLYPIQSMSTSTLVFFSNIPDSYQAQEVTYQLLGTDFVRGVVQPGSPPTYAGTLQTSTPASYVHNAADNVAIFRYFDANGAEVTDMNQVRSVASVTITLNILSSGKKSEFSLSTRAALRNLKTP